jgi:NAD(P)-dependent dehydrogenase (short-subunit alcohol dehydrogenase family)
MTISASDIFKGGLLAGQTAFITGGGSGINQGIAIRLAQFGARVVVVGRTQSKLDDTVQKIRAAGGEALGVAADVRDYAAMAAAAKQGAEAFGPYRIVIAGAAGNFLAPAANLSSNGFAAVIDIDLKGTFHTFRATSEYFAKDDVRCLAISAPQGDVPMPMQSHVCSAKSGVNMLVRTLAMEWGSRSVRVNAISPGYVANTVGGDLLAAGQQDKVTKFLPIQRFTTVDEMADFALTMVSPLCRYMTGQIVALDGGVSLLGGGMMYMVSGQG